MIIRHFRRFILHRVVIPATARHAPNLNSSGSVHPQCIPTNMSPKRSEESFKCSMLFDFGQHLPNRTQTYDAELEPFGFAACLVTTVLSCIQSTYIWVRNQDSTLNFDYIDWARVNGGLYIS